MKRRQPTSRHDPDRAHHRLLDLVILASAALPSPATPSSARKENELRRDLREMKDAIDRYKDLADLQKIRVEVGSENYPPDLETLSRACRSARPTKKSASSGKYLWIP